MTTGNGEDLMQAASGGGAGVMDWISPTAGMSAVEAYMLCSVRGDLKTSEIVDMPNLTVSLYRPKPAPVRSG
ncbi:MAG: hypothetical protein AAF360_01165 [Pseudomonadota bacterium]